MGWWDGSEDGDAGCAAWDGERDGDGDGDIGRAAQDGEGMGTRKGTRTRDEGREMGRGQGMDEDGDAKRERDDQQVDEPWKPSPASTLDSGGRFSSDREQSRTVLMGEGTTVRARRRETTSTEMRQ